MVGQFRGSPESQAMQILSALARPQEALSKALVDLEAREARLADGEEALDAARLETAEQSEARLGEDDARAEDLDERERAAGGRENALHKREIDATQREERLEDLRKALLQREQAVQGLEARAEALAEAEHDLDILRSDLTSKRDALERRIKELKAAGVVVAENAA